MPHKPPHLRLQQPHQFVDRVEVRGRIGRASLTRGVLEWVEDGRLVRLSSDTLSLGKLHPIAQELESQ